MEGGGAENLSVEQSDYQIQVQVGTLANINTPKINHRIFK